MSEQAALACTELVELPAGLLECTATELHRVLPGPTLLHLRGRSPRPLFVSTLLHGNEHTGLHAVQRLLRRYGGRQLPRALTIFFGNVAAARVGARRLDGQHDYNRIWPGTELPESAEVAMAREVFGRAAELAPFAAIDVHNNTGTNPLYGCVTRLEPSAMHLAALFSRIAILFSRPLGTLAGALSACTPAIAIECGKSGVDAVAERVADFIDACLHLDHFPEHPVAAADLELYRTVATVRIPPSVPFSCSGANAPLSFRPDLERLNFRQLPAGTVLATVSGGDQVPLDVRDERDRPATSRYFARVDGELLTSVPVIPSMLTADERIIRQDVLCYLMQPIGRAERARMVPDRSQA